MRAEHLKGWLAASKRRKREATEEGKETTDGKEGISMDPNWERLVDLVQTEFKEGGLADEATWHAVVLFPLIDQNHRLPRGLIRQSSLLELRLDQVHLSLPIGIH